MVRTTNALLLAIMALACFIVFLLSRLEDKVFEANGARVARIVFDDVPNHPGFEIKSQPGESAGEFAKRFCAEAREAHEIALKELGGGGK